MQLVFVDNLRSGMIVAEDVFSPDNQVIPLVRRNTVLNRFMIDRLKFRQVRFAYIKEKKDASPEREQPPKPRALYVPKPKPIVNVRLREDAIDSLQDLFDSAAIGREDMHVSTVQVIRHLDEVVEQLVDSLTQDEGALVNINDLKSYDEYTFHHSLSVAVLAIAIAQRMGFERGDLKLLGKTSLMHDIGKTAVPIEIIQKPSRLSDFEFQQIMEHSPAGYEYLHKKNIGDEEIWESVLFHHEKLDGTGYPRGLKDSDIPLWSRIISVADVYDALTSNRPYRTPMQPFEAIEYIMGGVGTSFDYDVATAFVNKVELYPVGSTIELSNGTTAVVLNTENAMRPVVRIIQTGEIMDLYRDRQCLNVVVRRLVDDSRGL